jgi:polysaccharide biosynthesis/export protein
LNVRLIFSTLLILLLSACAANVGNVIETGPRFAAVNSVADDYKLAAGDKVRLTVFNEPALSGEFSVSTTGALSFPLVGDVQADGKSIAEITSVVQKRLADGYLRDPNVSLEVTTYRPFFILGEVSAPGQYPYASNMTVLNAVATAQGFTPRADSKIVYIRRAGGVDEQAYRLTPDLRVLPGDTIRLGERFF